jgi:hypothetical protein
MKVRYQLGHTAYHHVGEDVAIVAAPQESALLTALRLGAQGLCVFHGYKRNGGSLGWAISWGVLAFISPVITTGVAVAQGVGRRKGH